MQDTPPPGEQSPLDLSERTITAWVYAASASEGEPRRPNGFQVFVKDENWNAEYGAWKNIDGGTWMQLTLSPRSSRPTGGWMDTGFNPKKIVAVGVKMATGDKSRARFQGAVFVDEVDW